mgnify:CR=1 FL=1
MAEQTPRQHRAPPKTAKQVAEDYAPWKPAKYGLEIATAFQSLMRGDCPAHLQTKAVKFILFDLCGVRDLSFLPGPEGARETDFAEGKRFVGLQIGKLLETKVNRGGEQG